ncbi:uncharacterized protein BT62DRAFT_997837 [Guyanagaster necrorhizus]|uniref:Uncharacterized protein n=1 Tax=Guyanagaster necrorhizus TaxID=856835 RepID=A0A9P7VG58_9AGAR|nr:uncharacterized protein BT62DRAFT_997837 [Guyanagaster necrorhizus MCA 3950]KAG7440356.1 hypothetical protein BT62DRAFT_997837 [Guyanagaster necrorhizus MCA 3950]
MTSPQQQPWNMLTGQEKTEHALLYPDYKHEPRKSPRVARKKAHTMGYAESGHRGRSSRSRQNGEYPPLAPHSAICHSLPCRRSSSCPPPGSVPAAPPAVHHEDEDDVPIGPVFETRDDLQRRPSRIMTYHSSSSAYPSSFDVSSIPMQLLEPEELSYSWPADPREFQLIPPSLLCGMADGRNGFISSDFSDVQAKSIWIEPSWDYTQADTDISWAEPESFVPYLSTEDIMSQWYQEVKKEEREILFDDFRKDQQHFDTTLFIYPFASRAFGNASSSSPAPPSLSPLEIAPNEVSGPQQEL